MNVTAWLEGLGLNRYAGAFADNDIDAETLPALTEDDLKELGVASLGHRKKLLAAIAASTAAGAPAVPVSGDRQQPHAQPQPQPEGERRQVTVLFADMTNFTRMTAEHDAEEVHARLNRYFEAVDGVVRTYGGAVDKHIGDAVMAVFGAPVAHDDDPDRAVHAALGMHAAAALLDPPVTLHIGIASGQVVASGTGSEAYREYTVTGESVNLASRLQAEAGSGETLIAEAVRRALRTPLEGEEIPDLRLKGIDGVLRAWRVTGLGGAATAPLGPIVGRAAELRQFAGALASCRETGSGQVIHLRGEAGIGKTRLIEEFRAVAAGEGFLCHGAQAIDFGAERGQDAIGMLVRSLLGVGSRADAQARHAAIEHAVQQDIADGDGLVFLNDLMDLPQPPSLKPVYDAMDETARTAGRRDMVADLVRRAAVGHPVLLTLEDLHWADASVLSCLSTLAAGLRERAVLMVLTSRPEGDPVDQEWRAAARGVPLATVDLGPLGETEAMQLALTYRGAAEAVVRNCVLRADGNPLFLDQLLRNAEEGTGDTLPGSMQSIVLARMDGLDPRDKAVLQAASVIGQRFSLGALRFVAESASYDCATLVRQFLVRPDGDDLLFAHALLREGVYGSLLIERRSSLHRRAAAWFADGDPALRAEHLGRAGDGDAPGAYLEASLVLAETYRHDRALSLAEDGLALAARDEDRFALICQRADLLQTLGRIPDSIDAYRSALDLAGTDDQRCHIWVGIAAGVRLLGGYAEGIEALEQAEALAGDLTMEPERAQIHHYRGNFFFSAGDLDGCMAEQEKAVGHAERAGDPEWQARALGGLGDAYYARCRMSTSLDYFRRCIALCQEHGLGRIEVANRFMVGVTRRYMNEFEDALGEVIAATDMARRVGNLRAMMYGLNLVGEFLNDRGEWKQAEAPLAEGLEIADALGNRRFRAYLMSQQARGRLIGGNPADAREIVAEAVAISDATDPRFIGPRVRGVAALAAADEAGRARALGEGEDIIALGCAAHNHLWFYRDAIDACLLGGDWDAAERFAARLEAYTAAEPLPWSDFFIARARALAAHGRGAADPETSARIERLRDQALTVGYRIAAPALDRALQPG